MKLNVTVDLLLFFLCMYRYMIYPLIVHYSPFQTGYFLFAFKCTGNNLKWKSGYISYILFVFQLYFPLLLLLLVFHLFFLERNKALEGFIHVCACMPPLSGEKTETHLPSTVKGMFNSCHFSAAAAVSVVAVESLTWIINRVGEIHTAVMVVLVVVMKDAKGDILQSNFLSQDFTANPLTW